MVRGYSSPSLPGTSASCSATAGSPCSAGRNLGGESLARLGPAQQGHSHQYLISDDILICGAAAEEA